MLITLKKKVVFGNESNQINLKIKKKNKKTGNCKNRKTIKTCSETCSWYYQTCAILSDKKG